MTIEDFIIKLLDENSGGMKLTELIVPIVSDISSAKVIISNLPEDLSDFTDFLLSVLEKMEENKLIGILRYFYPRANREKMFVYIPLP